jgi:hypothetical protein
MTEPLQTFELYLETAEPYYFFDPPGGGVHPEKFGVVLLGGPALLGKPANSVPDGERQVKSEAAAWQVAKALDWAELVSVTVLRTFTTSTAPNGTLCSLQLLWPAVSAANNNFDEIDDDQMLRAGVFDFVTQATDRTATNNWLFVRCVVTSTLKIMLVDNAWSFGVHPGAETIFVTKTHGRHLPEAILQAVERLRANAATSPLSTLLDAVQLAALDSRCAKVLSSGTIP